jgi:hypothetical protein
MRHDERDRVISLETRINAAFALTTSSCASFLRHQRRQQSKRGTPGLPGRTKHPRSGGRVSCGASSRRRASPARHQPTPQRPSSRKDYEALAAKAREADEDFGTARLVARARQEIAAGISLIPKEVVDRIAGGENALRVFREWRGKTQLFISHKTNIGQGYLSDLESGRRKGTTAALKKIADVLKVPLDLLV